MKVKLPLGLMALNLVLAATQFILGPQTARAEDAARLDCCQYTVDGVGFCCDNCCWFTSDCEQSADCPDKK